MIRQGALLAEDLIEAEDVARAAIFLLSDDARYITGENIQLDGGYGLTALNLLPRPGKVTLPTDQQKSPAAKPGS